MARPGRSGRRAGPPPALRGRGTRAAPHRHRTGEGEPGRRPGPSEAPAGRADPSLRRPDPAAQGPRRAAARGGPAARARPELRDRLVVPVVGGPSGSGLARPEDLHKLAAALGITDVVLFHPPVGQDRLADWYRAASVLVMPSHSESFGLVAVEAQACGTPVIAARVGGLPVAVRDGLSGVLVPGHDPADYARALARFADDPALSVRMGAAAARHARSFGWDATAVATAHVYAEALRERRARGDGA
ncbi:glycosyltransferase [Streptomyces sp. NPDC014806]|uniref:glycosyltransferase n=1 Tax=Streptomyces sp. NPDC014806 TaxID=3364920 RepID=UPI0036F8DF7E